MSVLTWRVCWFVVFTANLIVPLMLGWQATEKTGRLGMFVATFFSWLWADYPAQKSQRFAYSMLVGGVLVGLTQFFPVLQLVAGIIGFGIASSLGQTINDREITSQLGAFVVTAVTGSLLQVGALSVGWLCSLGARFSLRGQKMVAHPPAGVFDREMDA